jgi:hypothetical protein
MATMTTNAFEKFHATYNVVGMTRNSICVQNKETYQKHFMHRNAFNLLRDAIDFRETERFFHGVSTSWIEVLIWRAI